MPEVMDYQEELEKCHTMEDITGPGGLVQRVIRDAVQQVMDRELERHIAEEKENGGPATRNGSSHKTLKTSHGNIGIDGTISNITDKINDGAEEWYCRTLEPFYPVVFPDAIRTVFPETRVQLCVIHQIRNTLRYVSYKDQRAYERS